jgi:small subunit ribosomal protein S20
LAHHKSAQKRIRQSERRRKRNQHIRTGMRTHVKHFRQAIEAGDATVASERLKLAEKAIRQAATKGVIPKRRADRAVSRMSKSLNGLASA